MTLSWGNIDVESKLKCEECSEEIINPWYLRALTYKTLEKMQDFQFCSEEHMNVHIRRQPYKKEISISSRKPFKQ